MVLGGKEKLCFWNTKGSRQQGVEMLQNVILVLGNAPHSCRVIQGFVRGGFSLLLVGQRKVRELFPGLLISLWGQRE